jgi:OmcA/MtrC family decaheme c-type cytochrome
MNIGKRASKVAATLLWVVAMAAFLVAQVNSKVDGTDESRPDRRIRTDAASATTSHVSAMAMAPAHSVSRTGTEVEAELTADESPALPAVYYDPNELQGEPAVYTALDKAYYATTNEIAFYRLGLKFTILDIQIPADRRPVVTFKMTDDAGLPLDRQGILTPGAVSSSFILAYLPASANGRPTDYVDYSTRVQGPSPITGRSAAQAAADSGGSYTPSGLNDGVYTYRFGTTLPANYNAALTHTLGIYGRRDLREFGFSFYVSNPTKNFVPNGSPVTQVHQLTVTANCNQCHDPLALHGETGRREVEICVLCHTPQTTDPDTGNTVDMKVMIHKIHMGKTLPSVVAGTPYQIIGNAQSVADYSNIGYPQDIRNCQTCHKNAAQANAWMLAPSIEACGSCHDDVNFATGANHAAGAYSDSSRCATCHLPTGDYEWDASVAGAHTVPYKSNQLLFPKVAIVGLTNTTPGQNPVLTYRITDKNGNALSPAQFTGASGSMAANFAGPTTDYSRYITESISGASYAGGVSTYTFKTKIPSDASGTWALELEGRLNATLIVGGDPTATISQRDAIDNVVKYFAVTGATVTPRRTVVSIANCNKCHEKLQPHGSNRNQIEACVVCHNPNTTDASRRPASANPPESVSMQYLIHKLHTGEELENGYTVYGFGGSVNDFAEVLYPGDRRNCNACHVGTSYTIPTASGLLPVTTPRNYWTPTQPMGAACIACHDSVSTAAHVFLNTTTFGGTSITAESCPVCHKEGADFAVTKSHSR